MNYFAFSLTCDALINPGSKNEVTYYLSQVVFIFYTFFKVVLNWLWQRDGGDVIWEGVGRRMDINAATTNRKHL